MNRQQFIQLVIIAPIARFFGVKGITKAKEGDWRYRVYRDDLKSKGYKVISEIDFIPGPEARENLRNDGIKRVKGYSGYITINQDDT